MTIFFLGTFLRFYQLGAVPNSLNWDEVSWGYNAYSILHTGKDEWGVALPLSFRSFGDYKQPVYVYSDVLPIAVFGLTPFAVRLPSAFFGSLSIIFVYLLVYELFRKESYGKQISLLAILFYAISPWSIQFSRVAFEANVGLFFVILGTWLFLKAYHSRKKYLFFLAALFLSISSYTYHSEKIFTPLFFIVLCFYAWQFFKKQKAFLIGLFIFYLFCNILWLVDTRTTARGRSVLFTSQQTQILSPTEKEIAQDGNSTQGMLVHNRRLVYLDTYLKNYLLHFDPNFLFVTGSDATHHAPGMGMLYLFSLPFIIAGFFGLLKDYKKTWIVYAWFFLAPIAAALAVDAPNASRSMVFLPMWDIFTAAGILLVVRHSGLSRISLAKKLTITLVCVLFAFNFLYYFHQYFSHTNIDASRYWQDGYRQAVEFINQNENGKPVYFAPDIQQAYIFYLLYTKYDPGKYISQGGSERTLSDCYSIDAAMFGNCKNIKPGTIIISSNPSYPEKKIQQISYPSSYLAVGIYEKK